MKDGKLRSIFPEVVRPLLPGFFDHEAPREEKATCDACAMCAPPGAPASDAVVYFRPDVKCCTYHPVLPNYLVGAILADERPDLAEGKRRIRERIALRLGVSPQWIAPSRKVDLFLRLTKRTAFGRSLTILCPYFERTEQNCTIWRHRETVCSTFFCKYERGADGQEFWRTLRWYGTWLEATLSARAAESVIPGHREPKPLEGEMTLEELEDRGPPEARYAALWEGWAGREEELYVRCFEWVRGLGREGFAAIEAIPAHAERILALGKTRDKMLHPVLPERLVPNPEMQSAETAEGVLVTSYGRYEPLMLTRDLFEVVKVFGQGGTVAEVRERLAREHGVDVPDDLLVGLYQFQVLVAG
jgi:Fe-S-cluster containining protein